MAKINFNGQDVEVKPLSADERKNAPTILANGISDGLKDGDIITFEPNVTLCNVSGIKINNVLLTKPVLAYPCKVARSVETFDYLVTKSALDARGLINPNPTIGEEKYLTINEKFANIGFIAQEKLLSGKSFTVKKVESNTVKSFESYKDEKGVEKQRPVTELNPTTGTKFTPTKARKYNQFI